MNAYLINADGEKLYFVETADNAYSLKKEDLAAFSGRAVLSADEWKASVGEDGYFLVPMDKNCNEDVVVEFKQREDDIFIEEHQPLLPFFAIKKGGKLRLFKISHTYGWKVRAELVKGEYVFSLTYDLNEEIIDEDITITEIAVDGNEWYDAANAFRTYATKLGELVPLSEKRKREAVDYALRSPLIRVRMGWKPVPSPVESQTPENEPPMHVACSFERVRELAAELKNSGIDKAEIQLVGWNIGGHDGRWPQAFPADERLGGDDELIKTIKFVQSLGYMIDCHYNSYDSYEIADNYRADLVAKHRDGSHALGGSWGGGRSHLICADRQLEAVDDVLKSITEVGFKGLSYSDVLSIVYPQVCFDPAHPCSTARALKANAQTMLRHRELMGGFSSEGTYYHALRELDYALYSTFSTAFGIYHGCHDSSLVDGGVPFTYAVIHGSVLYNVSSQTINYTIKSPSDRLDLYEKGGRPSFYFYSKFKSSGANWMGEDDLTLATDAELKKGVAKIKEACDEYAPLIELACEYIVKVDAPQNGVRVITYSNGKKMIVNRSDSSVTVQGVTVAPSDFSLA